MESPAGTVLNYWIRCLENTSVRFQKPPRGFFLFFFKPNCLTCMEKSSKQKHRLKKTWVLRCSAVLSVTGPLCSGEPLTSVETLEETDGKTRKIWSDIDGLHIQRPWPLECDLLTIKLWFDSDHMVSCLKFTVAPMRAHTHTHTLPHSQYSRFVNEWNE